MYDLCVQLEHAKAVDRSLRYENLVPFGCTEHRRVMSAEARGAPAYIDRDIEYRTRRHTQQLGLRKGRDLEV
jgi:hypothetical protein